MITRQDEELWARHNLKPGDKCPFCGELLSLVADQGFFAWFWPRSWLRCSAVSCEFALRHRKRRDT